MTSSKKTDNHNPEAKLALRRHFLSKYDEPRSVFDCCQGGRCIWNTLDREFEVAKYFGVDLKPKKGRLRVDSVRVLMNPGWDFNVIDVDTYGEPWKHWEQILKNATRPTTVFLTIATIKMAGGGNLSSVAQRAIGVDRLKHVSRTMLGKLSHLATDYMIGLSLDFGRVVEAAEVENHGNARYIGIRFCPRKNAKA